MPPAAAPAREVLERARRLNEELGHEALGPLTETHGLLFSKEPLRELPPSHRAWDAMMARLPELLRTMQAREALRELPLLPADPEALPDRFLNRAASLLGILAHAYYRVDNTTQPDGPLPPALAEPWDTVCRRLGRGESLLTYTDLILNNWKFVDPSLADPFRLENLELLFPTVGNKEEHIFYLTQIEMNGQCAAVVGAAVRAQEAVLAGDRESVARELRLIEERLMHITQVSFLKIDLNPHSKTYVDPVMWAKVVGPFAVPFKPGIPGPGGTAAPPFHLLDVLFERKSYQSFLGEEAMRLRPLHPRHTLELLGACARVSVRDFVTSSGDAALKEAFRAALDAYAGEKGFLGAHKMKAYAFIEIGFKVGRDVTLGGFAGIFKDRAWNNVDKELEVSRRERWQGLSPSAPFASVKAAADAAPSSAGGEVKRVVLDVAGAGVRYQPGDRVAILPENSAELVEKTLRAMRATGDEKIKLDDLWREAVGWRDGFQNAAELPLRTLLRFGKIRPVLRPVAKALLALTASGRLRDIVEARMEDQWELWDLLTLLGEGGFDARRLWKAEWWEKDSVCKLVPPEPFRMYSVSSAMEDPKSHSARELHLTVAELAYKTAAGPHAPPEGGGERRLGTASNFFGRVAAAQASGLAPLRVPLRIVRPPRFHLPADPARPVVMFAAGAGYSPFRGFLHERERQRGGGENWLFFGTRTREHFFYKRELESLAGSGRLQLRIAFSNDDVKVRWDGGEFVFEPAPRARLNAVIESEENARELWRLLRSPEQGGAGANLYICGRTEVAASVQRSLKAVLARHSTGTPEEREADARRLFYRLVAEGRLMQDVFTTYAGAAADHPRLIDASELVEHNERARGVWMAVSGKVYDVTEFLDLHPGGARMLTEVAGMDATGAYQQVLHHVNAEVDALLGMYEIGRVRRLRFGSAWGVRASDKGLRYVSVADAYRAWVRFTYLVVEMENALLNDFSVLGGATTRGEADDALSPLKLKLLLQAHHRFWVNYLEGILGAEIRELWATVVGLVDARESAQRLGRELDAAQAGPEQRAGQAASDALRALVEEVRRAGELGAEYVPAVQAWIALVEREDRAFLAAVKEALRGGLRAFEEHQAAAPQAAGARLLGALEEIPRIARGYYTRLAAAAPGASSTRA